MLDPDSSIPVGLCRCGCGRETNVHYGVTRWFIHGHKMPKPIAPLFWRNVTPGNPAECWEWGGCRTRAGYGSIHPRTGYRPTAHRVSYELHFGPIPHGMLVCHRCDNPPCVNPAHLFLGSNLDNIRDMDRKGRRAVPSSQKLSVSDVAAIRERIARGGISMAALGREYGVTTAAICHIKYGRTFRVSHSE